LLRTPGAGVVSEAGTKRRGPTKKREIYFLEKVFGNKKKFQKKIKKFFKNKKVSEKNKKKFLE
jgi:hypothetical protein